jgi:hypothetical protein
VQVKIRVFRACVAFDAENFGSERIVSAVDDNTVVLKERFLVPLAL